MKTLHDVIYDILTEHESNVIPKLEALYRIMIEIKRDVDKIEKDHIKSSEFLGEVSKKFIDINHQQEKEISKLTRKLLKV